jgi:CrcB protein
MDGTGCGHYEGSMVYFIVFLGAGIGGVLRYGVSLLAALLFDVQAFPYGTLAINVTGSFAMGLIAEYFVVRTGLPQHLRLFLTTGILGGFTTFSSFSLEAVLLYRRGDLVDGTIYIVLSVALCLGALTLGLAVVRRFLKRQEAEGL